MIPWARSSLLSGLLVITAWMLVVEAIRRFTAIDLPTVVVAPNLALGYLLYGVGARDPIVDTGSHFPLPHPVLLSILLLVSLIVFVRLRHRDAGRV